MIGDRQVISSGFFTVVKKKRNMVFASPLTQIAILCENMVQPELQNLCASKSLTRKGVGAGAGGLVHNESPSIIVRITLSTFDCIRDDNIVEDSSTNAISVHLSRFKSSIKDKSYILGNASYRISVTKEELLRIILHR